MRKFICILGGTGFSIENPRIKTAISFLKANHEYGVITSGLGIHEVKRKYERAVVADLLREAGITNLIITGIGGDKTNRGHRDDILQILNAVPWNGGFKPEFVFLTEGLLHAFRVQIYARAQASPEKTNIRTMNCGPTDWNRRFKEIKSTAKCLWWYFTR
ncbi:MAG: hypothetical protein Q7S84_04800 [bacterium]|nr:hypothetical protein [bacterium]